MSVLEHIGQTPLLKIDGVFVKLECSNPGGSIKDRIARFLIEQALERGELKPGDTVVEATSGNTGIALALVCRALGLKALIFMPEHMSRERRGMLEALGAEVRLTPEEEGFEGPIERRNCYRDRPGCYVPDQFGNPDNVRCHELTTGRELLEQLAEMGRNGLDAFVAGVGTGGTLMGVGRALRATLPNVEVVAVEPAESNVMSGGEPGSHGIQGIGDGFVPAIVEMDEVDRVMCIPTPDAKAEADRIRRDHGYCVGISAGANQLAARRLAREGRRVATVWPDCSDRYVSMGLESPDSVEVTCPSRSRCLERTTRLLAELAATSGAEEEGPPP